MKKEPAKISNVESLSLRDAAVVVLRDKRIILLTFATTAVAALVLAVLMPDQYESRENTG